MTDTETAVYQIKWDSGVTVYLRLTEDGAEIATLSNKSGEKWNIREVDQSTYLADLRHIEPDMDDVPEQDSPWGEDND